MTDQTLPPTTDHQICAPLRRVGLTVDAESTADRSGTPCDRAARSCSLCAAAARAGARRRRRSTRGATRTGNLVLSNRPAGGRRDVSCSVPQAERVRATRFVAAERSRGYDDLIVEHARRTACGRSGARGRAGRIRRSTRRAVDQGRAGADAADAGDGAAVRRRQPVQPGRERPGGVALPAAAARSLRQQRSSSRSPPTTPVPAPSTRRPERPAVSRDAELRRADQPDGWRAPMRSPQMRGNAIYKVDRDRSTAARSCATPTNDSRRPSRSARPGQSVRRQRSRPADSD